MTVRSLIIVTTVFILLITLPYLYAVQAGGKEYVFGGFLLNPVDGNSYLAKIYQGWRGDWRFTLPYTAQPGEGAYLYLFYLFLGHLARLLNLPLIWVFHLARLIGALVLLVALRDYLRGSGFEARWLGWAFALAALGSGMGWLVFASGLIPADFWVAETYPFLSSFVNPHFALGLALLLWILLPSTEAGLPGWLAGLAALLLSIVSPFGVIVALCVLAGFVVFYRAHQSRRQFLHRLIWVFVGGAPLMLYDLWVTHSHPMLAGWNAQNLTPTPALWDVALSLSPALLLALAGARQVIYSRSSDGYPLLVWAALGLVLIYAPFGLQRRFMIGLFVPLVGLASYGLGWLAGRLGPNVRTAAGLFLCLSLPTNILLLLVAQHGVSVYDPLLYLTRGEAQAMTWIEANTASDALVLCAPETGMFIPAHTGRHVLYGHPFETVDAQAEKATVERFFQAGDNPALPPVSLTELLSWRGVDYVFYGPRERSLGSMPTLPGLKLVYNSEGVQIYQVAR